METNDKPNTSIYYVAGLARHVLVRAGSPDAARAKGEAELGRSALTVRLATRDEIDMQAFPDCMPRESPVCGERDLVHCYTRAQAIEDGALVDVTTTAQEAGIKYPVALTRAVWCQYVEVPEGVECQDEGGRLWDLLWMLCDAIRKAKPGTSIVLYQLHVRNDNRRARAVTLKAVCGPADDGSPCITVLLPDED
jgi:hypothetical protein